MIPEIRDLLVEVDRKVDRLGLRSRVLGRQVEDHERRIRRQERRQWPLPSLVAVMSAISIAIDIATRR